MKPSYWLKLGGLSVLFSFKCGAFFNEKFYFYFFVEALTKGFFWLKGQAGPGQNRQNHMVLNFHPWSFKVSITYQEEENRK